MTRNEVADFIGCTPRWIDHLWRDPTSGFPAPYYIGRHLRFPRDEVRAWRERQRARRATTKVVHEMEVR